MGNRVKVDRAQVVGFRAAQQHLGRRTDLGTAAGTAPQNTPPGSAQLALRVRADVTSEDVARAIEEERSLVQVWSLRGSPCIVTAAELPLFTVGLLPDDEESWQAVMQGFLPVLKQLGRSATETMALVIEATRDALDGAVLTKRELGAALGKRLPPDFGPWMEPDTFSSFSAILTRAASLTGEVTIAPRIGAEASFLRTDQWLQRPSRLHPSAARKALVRRYLQLYGPSTVEDFTSWAGTGESFARRSWGLVESELTEVGFDGRSGFVLASDLQALQAAELPCGVRLLPPYEPYLQQRDRVTAVLDVSLHRRIWRSTGNPGVVLANGEVRGLWRHRKQGHRLVITVESLGKVDREALEHEAQPYVAFRGCSSLDLVIG